ncbi:efflux RND transporter periplasmic adaptor subunit [Luteolibacter flavescens]|uniref:Efflux RND transporter periplasmic adaptor subunit n=1 Tax=Luteolibacter flavescens TaxID=1859460 RepID=A0ABT3FIK9_9BACT|nr:efflux RND transporter periplasmic adaptor subunit [Luteolibacter flavescens]MCW1883404.1 efflux RND transporter periplasmic adaptor subunit [Luteolibacter flavescens]
MNSNPLLFTTLVVALGLPLASCRKKDEQAPAAEAAPQTMPVTVKTITPQSVTVKSSQPGRLEAYRQAEIRARVPGIVMERTYEEGQEVKAGTALFRIDPAPFKAALDAATAALEEGEASLALAQDKKQRYSALVTGNAISARDMTEAESEEKQALARIGSAKADVETAKLRLDYATVTAPIDGRARRAEVTEGALVGEDSPTLLTTVEQIDPIYVNFSQPVSEVIALRKAMRDGSMSGHKTDEIEVEITLGDGSVYPRKGKLIFADLAVDAGTDSVQLRALVPNPDRELFPGMYVRVNMDVATEKEAILIPRDSLMRTNDGAMVMVVNEKNEVVATPVQTKEMHDGQWHVTSGLKGGDRVIIENAAYAPVGAVVAPTESATKPEAKTE